MRCDHCGQEIEEQGISNQHIFAGYGYFTAHHPECCPRELDGISCDGEHPDPAQVPPRTPRPRTS